MRKAAGLTDTAAAPVPLSTPGAKHFPAKMLGANVLLLLATDYSSGSLGAFAAAIKSANSFF